MVTLLRTATSNSPSSNNNNALMENVNNTKNLRELNRVKAVKNSN